MVNNGAIEFDKLDKLPPQELQEEIQRMKEAGSCEYLEDLCDESSIFTYKPPNQSLSKRNKQIKSMTQSRGKKKNKKRGAKVSAAADEVNRQ